MTISFGGSQNVAGGTGTSITLSGHAQVVGTVNLFIVSSPNNFDHVWPAASGYIKLGQQHSGASWTTSWGYVISNGTSSPTGVVTVSSTSVAIPSAVRLALVGSISLATPMRLASSASGTGTALASASYGTTRTNSMDVYLIGRSAASAVDQPAGYLEWTDTSNYAAGMLTDALPGSGDATAALNITSSASVSWTLARVEVFEDFPSLPRIITGISTAVAPAGPFKVAAGDYSRVAIDTSGTIALGQTFSGTGTTVAIAQTVTNNATSLTIPSVSIALYKTGTPTSTLYVEIRATDPNGTLLATSNLVEESTITGTSSASALPYLFTFASPPTISASAAFAVVLRRTTGNGTNLIGAGVWNGYAGGSIWNFNGTSWSSGTNDFCVVVNGTTTVAADAYYFFGRDSAINNLKCMKATDPATAWSGVANKTLQQTPSKISAYQVGNIIHLLVGQAGGTTTWLDYIQFDTTTDTFGTAEPLLTAISTAGQTGLAQDACSLVVRSTGEVVAFYNSLQTNTSGTPRARLSYQRRTGVNTWAAAVRVDANTAVDNVQPEAVLGTSDRVHFLWHAPASGIAATTSHHRALSSANVIQTAGTFTGNNNTITPRRSARSYDRAGTIKVVDVGAWRYENAFVGRFNSADVPTTATSALEAISGSTQPTAIFNDGTDVYVLARASVGLQVAKSTDDGATFGVAALAFTGTIANTSFGLSIDGNIYQRGNNVVIPYIVNDNGTLKYNEYVVRTITADAWNSGDKDAIVTLSNGDRTAASGTASGGVRSTATHSGVEGGKYYAELRYEALTGSGVYPFVGLSKTPGDLGSGDITIRPDGNMYVNGVLQGTLGTASVGDVTSIAWDDAVGRLWIRRNAGLWNVSGTANPATNVGGYDVAYLSGAFALWASFQNVAGQSVTVRTEKADFTQSTPAGFLSWMGEVLAVPDMGTLVAGDADLDAVGISSVTGTGALVAVSSTGQRGAGVSASSGTAALIAAASVRTNRILSSEDFDQAVWEKNNLTVTANAAAAPNGEMTAERIADNASLASHYLAQTVLGLTAGVPVTFSLNVKSDGHTWLQFQGGGFSSGWANYNVATGAVGNKGAGIASAIQPMGDGWYRLSITGTLLSAGTAVNVVLANADTSGFAPTYSGTGTAVFAWGAQFEFGTVATSYIKTTTVPVGVEQTITGSGTVSWNATGTLGGGVADLDALGLVTNPPATGTGALTSTAALAGVGVSSSAGTAALIAINTTGQRGAGISRSVSTSAALVADVGVVAAAGVSSSRSTTAALLASTSALAASGISASSGTAALTTQSSVTVAPGVSSSAGTAALVAGLADLDALGSAISGVSGSGALTSEATLAAAGISQSRSTVAALVSSTATVVAPGIVQATGAGILPRTGTTLATLTGSGLSVSFGTAPLAAQASAIVAPGVARWVMTGTLVAQPSPLVATGAARWVATGSMVPGAAALAAPGLSGSLATTAALQVTVASVSGFEGVTLISGTGSLQAQSAQVAGVAVGRSQGTGALLDAAAALAGAGLSRSIGTGALSGQACIVNSVGVSSSTATGALVAASALVAGGGALVAPTGTGALAASPAALAGSGKAIWTATGSLVSGLAGLAGAGVAVSTGTAALAAGVVGLAGYGGTAAAPTGTGALAASAADLDGTGFTVLITTGSGSLVAGPSSLAGAGTSRFTGSGEVAAAASALIGSGTARWIASGALAASPVDTDGAGVSGSTATAALLAPRSTVFGYEGVVVITGTGALQAQSRVVTGAGSGRSTGTGALLVQDNADLAGAAISASRGPGVLAPSRSALDGEGQSEVKGTAALIAAGSTLIGLGVGRDNVTGTGVLVSVPAKIFGAASLTTYGAGVLVTNDSHVLGAGVSLSTGFGVPRPVRAVIDGEGVSSVAGTAALKSPRALLHGIGEIETQITGAGMLVSRRALMLSFGQSRSIGVGDLQARDAKIVGGVVGVTGVGVIVSGAGVIVGTGYVGTRDDERTPFPSSYPGTTGWSGGAALYGGGARQWNNPGIAPWRKVS